MMRRNVTGKPGAERIDGIGINLLDESVELPKPQDYDIDAIWMS